MHTCKQAREKGWVFEINRVFIYARALLREKNEKSYEIHRKIVDETPFAVYNYITQLKRTR